MRASSWLQPHVGVAVRLFRCIGRRCAAGPVRVTASLGHLFSGQASAGRLRHSTPRLPCHAGIHHWPRLMNDGSSCKSLNAECHRSRAPSVAGCPSTCAPQRRPWRPCRHRHGARRGVARRPREHRDGGRRLRASGPAGREWRRLPAPNAARRSCMRGRRIAADRRTTPSAWSRAPDQAAVRDARRPTRYRTVAPDGCGGGTDQKARVGCAWPAAATRRDDRAGDNRN
jgi:hypothetical protein